MVEMRTLSKKVLDRIKRERDEALRDLAARDAVVHVKHLQALEKVAELAEAYLAARDDRTETALRDALAELEAARGNA